MTYQEAVDFLYNSTPQFQRIGAAAYKPGLDTAVKLAAAFDNPCRRYSTVHVAGTNGKGSTCHTLAAILGYAGYKTGLYTSPHLVDFRERIKVDGTMIPKEYVAEFVDGYRRLDAGLSPSFFELTTILAFKYFADSGCDVAVIETGLGGRLDTTNIIDPVLTIITNISFDHKTQLGNTLAAIAREKAGIIKSGVPVVIGNAEGDGVRDVFTEVAAMKSAPMIFACADSQFMQVRKTPDTIEYETRDFGHISAQLTGDCQVENAATILEAVKRLREAGYEISDDDVRSGFATVAEATGLAGRWMKVAVAPTVVCDTGHNEGGWRWLGPRLNSFGRQLRMVVGFVNDKDVSSILGYFPREAEYYFTQASVPRALPAVEVKKIAQAHGLDGSVFTSVAEAVREAQKNASPDDVIFIGGSTFVVADFLAGFNRTHLI